ncbi:MAG: glycosyltransferase [Erysipelotrichaceae bacterium]|nr:glycosyltransferase [Erysipelotrichaceae bacterium]
MSELTIIVAIYNVEDYLDRCLSSLKEQTAKDYEVFCVNDGSTDGSRDIIMKYVDSDSRFKVLDKKNGGLSDARNYGLERCESEYVGFIDGDDFVEKDYVEKAMTRIKRDGADMLVFAYKQYYLENGTMETSALRIPDGVYSLKEKKELLAYTPNAAWNKIYRTSLFKDNGIEYPFGYRHQDLGTTAKLMLKSEKISYLNEALYNYLVDRPNNITTQIDKKLYHIIDMSKEIMDYYKKEGVYDEYIDEFEYLIRRNFIQSLRKAVLLKDRDFVNGFIDDIFKVINDYFKNASHKYELVEEGGDDVYLSKLKCKAYYTLKRLRG